MKRVKEIIFKQLYLSNKKLTNLHKFFLKTVVQFTNLYVAIQTCFRLKTGIGKFEN